MYHFVVRSNFNFLHDSHWIKSPISCASSHITFCARLLLTGYYYHYFTLLRVFHIRVSWWFFTEVWVTASLFKCPELFSVFWPVLVILKSGWSLLVFWFLSPPVSFTNPSGIILSAPNAIGICITLMFHSFFSSQTRSRSLLLLLLYSFRAFHISVNWWFYTRVWVRASLLKSPGLVSGFWPFLAMLSFG